MHVKKHNYFYLKRENIPEHMFVHFTGNDKYEMGEQIYFSVSDNAIDWTHLNNNQPILKSTMGTTGVRDPYIVRSPEGDKFYMIATDLHIYGGGDACKIQNQLIAGIS